jgi:AcrR family transcriptional regulator
MPKVVDHKTRRHEISSVVASLISRGGLEAATIREIARESGYSKGVIEHYFENKGELIDGALAWANGQYEQRVSQATRKLKGMAALRKRIEATIPGTREIRDEWKVRLVFWSLAAIEPTLRTRQEQRFTLTVEHFENDFLDAVADGEISSDLDPNTEARHLVNLITGISIAALHHYSLYTRQFLNRETDWLMAQYAIRHRTKRSRP